MSIFGGLSSQGLEETQDRLGGFQVYDTDAYDATIKLAYAGQSDGGARSMSFVFDLGGREYRETLWVTNKKGENFFLNRDDQTKKVPLPGWTVFEDICLVTVEKEPKDLNFEEKVVKLYDFDQKKEVPTNVQMAVELIGQKVTLGIGRILENKSAKDAAGNYQPTAETREVNAIEKVFHTESRGTVVEARSGQEAGSFYAKWVDRNKGQTRDKRKIKDGDGGTAGRPGSTPSGPPQASAQAPKKSLFGGQGGAS